MAETLLLIFIIKCSIFGNLLFEKTLNPCQTRENLGNFGVKVGGEMRLHFSLQPRWLGFVSLNPGHLWVEFVGCTLLQECFFFLDT